MTGREVRRVGVIGAGVIGRSWVAQFLAAGLDVDVNDPDPGAADAVRAAVERQWPILERQGLAAGAAPDRFRMVTEPEEAVAGADFVQENGPERIEVKRELFARLDAASRPDVVLASSSSGLLPTAIQAGCTLHPERVVVGHPFNPPHLIPVVEVVGGEATGAAAVDAAVDFYRSIGKRPIRINTELPGHIVNRLQAALWREAYWLVSTGAVSVTDLDQAIAYGPGLRWALLGPFATQHLSGGPGGLAHVLEHLGPPMVDWWHSFQTPPWDAATIGAAVDGVDAELTGIDAAAMEAERDELLEELLQAKARARHLPGSAPEGDH